MELRIKPFIALCDVMTGLARSALANEIEVTLDTYARESMRFQNEPGYGSEHQRCLRVNTVQAIMTMIDGALVESEKSVPAREGF